MRRPNSKPDFPKDFANVAKRVERVERALGRPGAGGGAPYFSPFEPTMLSGTSVNINHETESFYAIARVVDFEVKGFVRLQLDQNITGFSLYVPFRVWQPFLPGETGYYSSDMTVGNWTYYAQSGNAAVTGVVISPGDVDYVGNTTGLTLAFNDDTASYGRFPSTSPNSRYNSLGNAIPLYTGDRITFDFSFPIYIPGSGPF